MKTFSLILTFFLAWRVGLFLVGFLATWLIPDFGARFPYFDTELISTGLPSWIWGFGNFDGVHYLRIAKFGYEAQFSQAFFPLYPILIKLFSFGQYYFWSGFLVSNLLFLGSLIVYYKLLLLDFPKQTVLRSVILLICFPTAYYFGSIYTESLFMFLVLSCLYALRKGNFLLAGLLIGLSSATRIMGISLLPVFVYELWLVRKEIRVVSEAFVKAILGLLVLPLGILFYMFFLDVYFFDKVLFLSAQPFFGAERSSWPLITLPQVLFRYLKIFMSVTPVSVTFLNALLEFAMTVGALLLVTVSIKRLRLSYLWFSLACLIIPTMTGTLSSMPRYALMSFLAFPILVERAGNNFKIIVVLLVVLQVILTAFFVRGYWVA